MTSFRKKKRGLQLSDWGTPSLSSLLFPDSSTIQCLVFKERTLSLLCKHCALFASTQPLLTSRSKGINNRIQKVSVWRVGSLSAAKCEFLSCDKLCCRRYEADFWKDKRTQESLGALKCNRKRNVWIFNFSLSSNYSSNFFLCRLSLARGMSSSWNHLVWSCQDNSRRNSKFNKCVSV